MHAGLIQQLSNSGLPQEDFLRAVFYLIAGLTVFFAFRIVISRNIFHGAIFLSLTLLGVACVYLYLDAEFMAMAQVLIYVGAVVTLFIFVIMLTANIEDRAIRQSNQQVLISAISALVFFVLIVKIIWVSLWQADNQLKGVSSLKALGQSLMTTYLLPFEIISLILIAVLVGAIVIGKVDKK